MENDRTENKTSWQWPKNYRDEVGKQLKKVNKSEECLRVQKEQMKGEEEMLWELKKMSQELRKRRKHRKIRFGLNSRATLLPLPNVRAQIMVRTDISEICPN